MDEGKYAIEAIENRHLIDETFERLLKQSNSSYQDWQRNKLTRWLSIEILIVSGLIVPKMRPTNHFGNIWWLKPVEPFANHHDYSGSEHEKTKAKIFMEVRAATVGTQELNINFIFNTDYFFEH